MPDRVETHYVGDCCEPDGHRDDPLAAGALNVTRLPMRARTAALNTADMHPRWADGTPVILGQDVMHATERWQGFVASIPSSEEVGVAWWMPDDEEYGDEVEHSPEELLLTGRIGNEKTDG